MINVKDIASKKFEKAALGGYKTDEVEEYLKDLSFEISQMQKENSELERKLEVLADKIREYRSDEDALKDALLGAQKQGNLLIAEAKKEAAKISQEVKERTEKQIKEADEKSKSMIADAGQRANNILNEANSKAEEIHGIMTRQTEKEQIILQQTRKEVEEFRNKIIRSYMHHIEEIKGFPEKFDNDFTKEVSKKVIKMPKRFEHDAVATENQAESNDAFITIDNSDNGQAFSAGQDNTGVVAPEKSGENKPFFELGGNEKNKDKRDGLQFGGKKK